MLGLVGLYVIVLEIWKLNWGGVIMSVEICVWIGQVGGEADIGPDEYQSRHLAKLIFTWQLPARLAQRDTLDKSVAISVQWAQATESQY